MTDILGMFSGALSRARAIGNRGVGSRQRGQYAVGESAVASMSLVDGGSVTYRQDF